MRRGPVWSRNARGLALLLLAVSLPPAVALVWFCARLLEQDRGLVAQWDFERRQAAAPVVVRALDETLIAVERAIGERAVPSGAVRVVATAQGVTVDPPGGAVWLPVLPPLREADDKTFANVDVRESRDSGPAMAIYQEASRSRDSTVRAGGLLRLARAHWVGGRWDGALDAYRRLEQIRDVAVLGAPADLQARRWAAEVLADAGRHDASKLALADLERDFDAGRWSVDRETWKFVSSGLEELTGRAIEIRPERRLVSDVADALWRERIASGRSRSRHVAETLAAIATVLTAVAPDRTIALILPPDTTAAWLQDALEGTPRTGAMVTLLSESGRVVTGPAPSGAAATVTVPTSKSGLPWTIALAPGDTADLVAVLADRRRLVIVVMAALVLLVAGSTYFVWRVMRRELAVSRLQTEFVAAVSHEFRTPLTALRHVTELLAENDEVPAERRQAFYKTLGRNAERLQRLVESLLDFSRMESGRKPYDLRDVDAVDLVRQVIDDFRRENDSARAKIGFEPGRGKTCQIRADAVSLSTAVWNLLDNAVKYSPDRCDILVRIDHQPRGVEISIRDAGMGIPARERRQIFDRFVRGAEAASRGIKGTGLGLALVSHIVRAHGGTIELESEVGKGSTFTIVLPATVLGAAEEAIAARGAAVGSNNEARS